MMKIAKGIKERIAKKLEGHTKIRWYDEGNS